MSQPQAKQSVVNSISTTIIGLLGSVNTTANLLNRTVNSLDQYAQTVERHAIDYNYQSELVSAKRREQLQEQYKLLSETEKALLNNDDIFGNLANEQTIA